MSPILKFDALILKYPDVCYAGKLVNADPGQLRLLWDRCRGVGSAAREWDLFWEAARPLVLRIARRAASHWGLNDASEADDLVQDICLKIMEQRQHVDELIPDEDGRFEAYFRVFAANTAQDSLRRRFAAKRAPREQVSLREDWDSAPAPGGIPATELAILLDQLETAIQLTARDQAIFKLYYRQGFSAREIAAIPALDLSVKGVESTLHRITRQLREAAFAGQGQRAEQAQKEGHDAK